MTCPHHQPPSAAPGCAYLVVAAALGFAALLEFMRGNPQLGFVALTAAAFAGRCWSAVSTIAHQRAELAILRRATRSRP
jgi:hypothetical protein